MDARQIIIRPVVTEKTFRMRGSGPGASQRHLNAYVFEVHPKANKNQIKKAVEEIYGVNVRKVNTMYVRGKWRRRGRTYGRTKDWKKAVVFLGEGQSIDVY